MAAAKGVNGKQGEQKKGLFAKKTGGDKTVAKKKVVKAKNTKAAVQKQQAAGRNARYQRQTVQRQESWDLVEKQPIPVTSVLAGSGFLITAAGYFGRKWWNTRHSKLITQFVDDMMDAGTDKRELAKIVVSYKGKLGPWSTPRLLQEYLKVVFRAPDLSPAFVEALDYVVTSLLRVKEDELFTYIAEVTKEMVKSQEYVGLSILLFVFERLLPPEVSDKRLEPLRRIVAKVFPGDTSDHMFELARDAYTLEVETYFQRMEYPLVAPPGYEVLGLREKDANDIFKKVKEEYQPAAVGAGGGELGQSLAVRKRDPMHEAIYGRVEDICDQHVSGYKDNKAKKQEDAKRARPATWDETVSRISRIVLTKKGENIISNLQRFSCLRCGRQSTLLPGQTEDEVFDRDYECPQCGSGRDMIIRTQ